MRVKKKPDNVKIRHILKPYVNGIPYPNRPSTFLQLVWATDVDRPVITEAMKSAFAKIDDDILDEITEVRVKENDTNEEGLLAGFDIDRGIMYIFPRPGYTKEDYRDTIIHELHHAWYNKELRDNPKKIKEFQKEVDLLPPVTDYARQYYDQWKQLQVAIGSGEIKNKEQLEFYRIAMEELKDAYYDEWHSETGEYIESNQNDKRIFEVLNKEVMKRAVELYNKLHGTEKSIV